MFEDEKWDLVHDYVRAVDQGKIEPLECKNDGMQLYIKTNKDFEPVFYCYFCEINTEPGLKTFETIKKLLKEIPVD